MVNRGDDASLNRSVQVTGSQAASVAAAVATCDTSVARICL
jgi:hypothetical protein